MDTLDPITLAGSAVAVAVVISGLLFLLFSTREESFESSQAAQRVEQEALLLSKQSSGKVQRQKKKSGKGKKKAVEHDSEGEPTEFEKEAVAFDNTGVEDVLGAHEQDQKQFKGSKNTAKDEKPKSVVKEKEGKKRGNKALHKDGLDSSEPRHENYVPSRKEKEEVVIEEVIQQVNSQAPEAIPEPAIVNEEILMTENEPQVSSEPPQTVKKPKSKSKGSKEKSPHVVSEDVNVKRLVESLRSANLNVHELQDLIDVLLDKQGESSQWRKSAAKGDTAEVLRKQLLEKEGMIAEERLLAQSATNKLKEVRDELQQERQKLKHQSLHATTKIQSQAKEIQALQARMQNTHETHSRESQNLQARLHQLEQMVESSSMPNIQQLQQENAQLKNSQMRAAQLVADKDALTSELAKVQQANRQVANELKSTLEKLKQKDTYLKAMEDKFRQHQNNKEAEMVVSKRLGEVSEELKKSEAKNSNLSADLEKAKTALKNEESKTERLQKEIKAHEAATTSHESVMNRLTDQLKEASDKVEKLEKQFPEIEQQQKELRQELLQKEAEIKEARAKQKDAMVPVKSELVETCPEQNEDLQMHQNKVKEKEDTITKLNEDLTKKDEELTNLKNSVEQLKTKNNELRQKNWKAMEALTAAEQNAQSVVSKALQAAKDQSNAASAKNDESNKEKDQLIAKLNVDLDKKVEEVKSLEQVVAQQKQKNNELREKNWKAMDAVSEAERSVKTQIGKAVEAAKNQGKNEVDAKIAKTKEILCKAHNGINVSDALPYEQWLMQFSTKLLELQSAGSKQDESLEQKLKEAEESYKQLTEECNHYRNGLETTEAMLKTLENNIESEVREWQTKVQEREDETRQVREKNESLEEQLLKNKSGENLLSAKVAELEDKLQQAEAAEEEAKEKAAAFYEELSVASNKPDQEALQKLDHLEKELVKVKALEDSLAEKMAKLESKDKEMTIVKKQLDAEKSQSSEKERKINVLNEELKKYKSTETELQKKISSLEDAVTKANNLTQSAESLDSVNNSPEKKKKGLKGAFNKVMGSSKKDKDKDKNSEKTSQLEEFQKQIAAYKAQVEELKDSKTTLEKKNQTLEDEKNDLQKRLTTSLDADNAPSSKSQHIEKAVAEAIADTDNSPIKSRLSLAKHSPGGTTPASSGSSV